MSFPRYPTYKPSGVEWLGEVPEHWEVTALKHGYVVTLGKMLQPEAASEGDMLLPYLRAANIRWSGIDDSDIKTMWFSTKDRENLRLQVDDLLVSEGGDVGRSALWKGEIDECYFQNSVNRVRPDNGNLTSFLRYWMSTMKDKGYIDVLCNKSTIAHFTAEKVGAVPVPLPPVDEQNAIAAFLDHETTKIDALIAEQQRLIELLQEKRQAVISHAVTKGLNPHAPMKDSGVEWLGEVPEHWELLQLKRLSRPGSSITYGIVQAGPHIEEGIPYIRTSDMSGDSLSIETCQRTSYEIDRSYTRSKVNTGDLVVAIRATVGKVLVVPEELDGANLTQGTAKFSPGNQVLTDFIKLSFESRYLQAQIDASSKGATFAEITLDALRRLVFAVPSISEQAEIASRVNALANEFAGLISDSQRSAALLQERRSALISAAVTGQIDVRGLVPEAEAA